MGTSRLGYESSWVRVVLGTSCLGYVSSWIRVVLGTSCPGYDGSHGNPAQIILNVYMPFYNGALVQTEKFVDTIGIMQSFVDEYVAMAPIKIVCD